jgi:hypothetical protein
MPQLDFFSVREDQLAILRFVLAETDIQIFEHSSRPDMDLRQFHTPEEVDDSYKLGIDAHGNGFAVCLALWSPSAMPTLETTRIDFDPKRVRNARFRYEPDGAGLMQLYFGGQKGLVITKSHLGHQSRERARAWGVEQGVDWEALTRVSRRIQYYIRSKMAVARLPGRPILPAAAKLWSEGYLLKESANAPFHWEDSGLQPDTDQLVGPEQREPVSQLDSSGDA